MKTADIRERFLSFFQAKKHHFIPAAPIIARDNPSLLFINAGMNPFTSIFLGDQPAPFPRVTNSQPCLRVAGKHNDLEEVGHDTYHHTFFEMLGNWSFGDYFQEKAIPWAWELLTTIYNLPQDRLYATVFQGANSEGLTVDTESYQLWKQFLPEEQIVYGSKADNFWEMGATGPCGPCSELHFDLRSKRERLAIPGHHLVNKGHPQVIEIWNLVFITYHRQANGQLKRLPQQSVDTGMGLERLAMAMQGKLATYDTDAFAPYLTWLTHKTGRPYGEDPKTDRAMRVIADHLRAVAFAIADGELPGTQKASYVIRRILRRAVRYGYSYLGLAHPFLCQMIPLLTQAFGHAFPRIQAQETLLQTTIAQEEESFLHTLSSGLKRLNYQLGKLPSKIKTLGGKTAFELYDTFGFPPDLTALIAKEQGYEVDQQGFEEAMATQKERAKQATSRKVGDWYQIGNQQAHSHFVGYDQLETHTRIVKYRTLTSPTGLAFQLVLEKTPFYPAGGGQPGDTGQLAWPEETIQILDTKKEHNLIIHLTKKLPHNPTHPCTATVDAERRKRRERNHSATHLLHAALRTILGIHVLQKGSLVHEDGLRFDFTHPQKMTHTQLQQVQQLVNDKIRKNITLEEHRTMPLTHAKSLGAHALFGEKYGKEVRCIIFDRSFSLELCSGTHVQATGAIGFFQLRSEKAVGAGIRRIEAVTGEKAEQVIFEDRQQLTAVRSLLRQTQDPVKAIQTLLDEQKKLRKTLETMYNQQLAFTCQALAHKIDTFGKTHTLIQEVQAPNLPFLRKLGSTLKAQHPQVLIALGATIDHHPHVGIFLGNNMVPARNAHEIVQQIAPLIQGKGGGQATMAIARGQATGDLHQALAWIRTSLT